MSRKKKRKQEQVQGFNHPIVDTSRDEAQGTHATQAENHLASPPPLHLSEAHLSDILSFSLNIKRNSHELMSIIDVVYGALLSFLLYKMSTTFSMIKAPFNSSIDHALFSLILQLFILIFILEDYRGMKLVTSICGYYTSLYRYFLDLFVVLMLFICILCLDTTAGNPPRPRFIIFFSLVYFCCAAWALLITKNEREVPTNYTWLILASHTFSGAAWLTLYLIVRMRLLGIEFLSWHFLGLTSVMFALYYITVMIMMRQIRKLGLPVDDFIEMFIFKTIRGSLLLVRSVYHTLKILVLQRRWEWIFSTYYIPSDDTPHYKILKTDCQGFSEWLTISKYVNENAMHASCSSKISLQRPTNTLQDFGGHSPLKKQLIISDLSNADDVVKYFIIHHVPSSPIGGNHD